MIVPSNFVSRAIKSGKLKRPDTCSECGKKCRPEAHHDDYSKLLEVRWLCRACHQHWHTENVPVSADGVGYFRPPLNPSSPVWSIRRAVLAKRVSQSSIYSVLGKEIHYY